MTSPNPAAALDAVIADRLARIQTGTPVGAETHRMATGTGHWLIPQPDGRYLLGDDDGGLYLSHDDLDTVARALRDTFFGWAPELVRVLGYQTADGMAQVPAADAAVYEADGVELTHGLACPHDGCGHVAWDDYDDGVTVVDEDERWSSFGYRRQLVDEYDRAHEGWGTDEQGRRVWLQAKRTGRKVWAETVTGSYADTDYQGLGYRCEACTHPVTLPAGVEEEGN